jgi:acetyl esterase/lipase/ubiquinone biosynthesis protein UbiJ
MWNSTLKLTLAAAVLLVAAAASGADEAQLIAVLQSGATQKEKMDACRELAHVGTKKAVPVLAGLLGDEKLSHMARYALEPIHDPAADVALREALSKVKGRPLLGVIGSLGVRRDAKAVDALAKLLGEADPELAQAAARALGQIGTPDAAKAIDAALAGAPASNQVAFCEGLFRCAEALTDEGKQGASLAIYDRLRSLSQAPQQVRAGSLRGAILMRGKGGIPLMMEAIRGADYVLTAAAARASMEMPGPEVTAALVAELPGLPPDKQILLANTLGQRGDASARPALLALAAKGPDAVRLAAARNFTRLGNFPGKDADAPAAGTPAQKDATGTKVLRDLAYVEGGHERNRLDLYLPERAAGRLPLVVWIHGGAWQAGSKNNCPAVPLVAKGYAVASINYRLSQHAIFPAQIEDCKAAIRWLRANAAKYQLDPDRIGVWGASAGGHLVAMLGTAGDVKQLEGTGGNLSQSSRVQCVVDWFGPSDLLTMAGSHDNPDSPESRLIGGPVPENKEKARKASPVTYVSKDSCPFLIMHGDKDNTVPLGQSEELAVALKKVGVEVTLQVIKGNGHGGPGFSSPESRKLIEDFFAKHLGKGKS